MIIIGITGTLGAGKGTIVDYLMEKYGFQHYSVRDYLIKEVKSRGMEVNRDSFVTVANDLRASHSPSYIVDRLYEQAASSGKDAIIESIRTPGEVQSMREKSNFVLVAVDADPFLRYTRIIERNSETDHVSFDTFLQNEKREMTAVDPNKQNIARCMEEADFSLRNDGNFATLHVQADQMMHLIQQHE